MKTKVVAVCEDHANDQCSWPYLVDLEKLPKDHPYRVAVEEGLTSAKGEDRHSGMGGEVDSDYSFDYSTEDEALLAARVTLPYKGTIVGLVKIYTD